MNLPPANSALVAVLPNPLMIEIAGVDATKVMNNLTTNDIQRLAVGSCCESFVTDLRGWVVAHGLVIKQADRILVWGSHPETRQVANHVDRYIIREDARVSDRSATSAILLLDAAPEASVWQCINPVTGEWGADVCELEVGGVQVLASKLRLTGPNCWGLLCGASEAAALQQTLCDAGARFVDSGELELRRIANFWPLAPADIREKTIPQELARDPQAISFTKGCYLGQETIARLDARGQLQKKLCLLELDGSQPVATGSPLQTAEKEVGQLTSVAVDADRQRILALAFLRRGNFEPGTALHCGERRARVLAVASD